MSKDAQSCLHVARVHTHSSRARARTPVRRPRGAPHLQAAALAPAAAVCLLEAADLKCVLRGVWQAVSAAGGHCEH